jgi:stage V sporulation protein D (sporulation-specific penicillin-binding protein)
MINTAGTNRGRVITLFWLFAGFACVLTARLYYLQWLQHDKYLRRADAQHLGEAQLPAIRGEIRDRNNVVLATSISRWSVAVNPEVLAQKHLKDKAVDSLAMILGQKPERVREVVNRPGTFGWISRKVDDDKSKRVRELDMDGVFLVKESTPGKRYYPKGSLCAQLLGTTGVDDQGLDGLEGAYEDTLRGRPGLLHAFMDRDGWATMEHPTALIRPAETGDNVILTIDETIQYVAERELAKQVKKYHAESGIIIVMDAKSADVLAMAINPTFASEDFGKVKPEMRRNRAVTDPYEPGSTFKVFLAASAVDCGVDPEDTFPSSGVISMGGYTIQNANDGLGANPMESLKEIITNSFNVGTSNVALHIGKQAFYKHLRAFGFGELTGIDLVGESEGILAPVKDWEPLNTCTISFGQGVAVTPIQLVSAMQAVANGGVRMKPRVVQAITDHQGRLVRRYEAEELGRPIKPETSRKMLDILENVVEHGTGKRARIPGYRVGGKTGTAQMVENGVYAEGLYVGSFMGIAPLDDPRVVVLVKLTKPQPYWGGLVAAPVFQKVMEKSLWKLGIKPNPKYADRVPEE